MRVRGGETQGGVGCQALLKNKIEIKKYFKNLRF